MKLNFPDAEERPLTRGHLDLGGKLKDGLLSRGMTLLRGGSRPRCSATIYGQFLFLAGVPSRL